MKNTYKLFWRKSQRYNNNKDADKTTRKNQNWGQPKTRVGVETAGKGGLFEESVVFSKRHFVFVFHQNGKYQRQHKTCSPSKLDRSQKFNIENLISHKTGFLSLSQKKNHKN